MNYKTVEEIVEGLQQCAAAAGRDNKRVTKFVLNASDYDRVYDHVAPIASGPKPAFFTLATAAGVVRVEPSDNLPIGDARVEIGLKERGRTIDAVYQSVKETLEQHYGKAAQPSSLPVQRQFSIAGKFRVYFNRHGAEPLMWCVSPEAGGWEIAVRDVQLATIAETVYRKKPTADEDDGRPSAWIAVEGLLTVNPAGFATIGAP